MVVCCFSYTSSEQVLAVALSYLFCSVHVFYFETFLLLAGVNTRSCVQFTVVFS